MKKIFFFTSAAVAALFMMSFAVAPDTELQENSYESVNATSDFKTITVYKVTMVGNGVASKQSIQAEFDKNSMELRVVEKRNGKNYTMTYSVIRNPYKGYSDDPRGRYDYCADHYYF